MSTHNLTLDISKKLTTHQPIVTRVEDTDSCVIVATILSNGEPYDLSGKTARFRAKRADGNYVSDDKNITIEDNVITYVMDSSVNAVSGTIYIAYFQILEGDEIIDSTGNITIRVLMNGTETGAVAPAYVSEVKKFLESAQKQIDDAIASIPDAEPITTDDIDEVIAGGEISNPNRTLTTEGLAYLWSKIETPDLTDYVTKLFLLEELEYYVTKLDLDLELEDYATGSDLNNAVSGFVNSSTVQNMIDAATKHFFDLADGENLPATVDLNDYMTPGTFTCLTDGASANIVNAPTNEYKFRLYVTGSTSAAGRAVGQFALIDNTDDNAVYAVARVTQNGTLWGDWKPVGGETLRLNAPETQTINSNVALGLGYKLLGTTADEAQHELIGVGEYEVNGELFEQTEVGSVGVPLNLNSDANQGASDGTARPTVDTPDGKKSVAYLDDIDPSIYRSMDTQPGILFIDENNQILDKSFPLLDKGVSLSISFTATTNKSFSKQNVLSASASLAYSVPNSDASQQESITTTISSGNLTILRTSIQSALDRIEQNVPQSVYISAIGTDGSRNSTRIPIIVEPQA